MHDIGLALSPMAYFAQFALDVEGVAMVTASHNDNGWTGIKMGFAAPAHVRSRRDDGAQGDRARRRVPRPRPGGRYVFVPDMAERYVTALTDRPKLKRKLKVVAACGNGTAGAWAPKVLEGIGCEVVPLDCDLDYTFPRYNPNPEDMKMLHAMARRRAARTRPTSASASTATATAAGWSTTQDDEIFADKVGVMLARDLSARHDKRDLRRRREIDGPVHDRSRAQQPTARSTLYWKTGHSYMKRHTHEQKALVGFEKSGHFFFQPPLGARLRRRPGGGDRRLRHARPHAGQVAGRPQERAAEDLGLAHHVAALRRRGEVRHRRQDHGAVSRTPPARASAVAGQKIRDLVTVNGVRVVLEDGTWGLVRASSNKPELVIVVESPTVGGQHARHLRRHRRPAGQVPGGGRVQPEDLRRLVPCRLGPREAPTQHHCGKRPVLGHR